LKKRQMVIGVAEVAGAGAGGAHHGGVVEAEGGAPATAGKVQLVAPLGGAGAAAGAGAGVGEGAGQA